MHLADDKFQNSIRCKIESDDGAVIAGVCYRSTSSITQNNDSVLYLLEKAAHQRSQSHLVIFVTLIVRKWTM